MNKSFETRLEALERGGRGHDVYIILFGDQCDAYDACLAANDEHGAFDVLRQHNPYVSDELLWQTVRERSEFQDISPTPPRPYVPSTLIRAEYEGT